MNTNKLKNTLRVTLFLTILVTFIPALLLLLVPENRENLDFISVIKLLTFGPYLIWMLIKAMFGWIFGFSEATNYFLIFIITFIFAYFFGQTQLEKKYKMYFGESLRFKLDVLGPRKIRQKKIDTELLKTKIPEDSPLKRKLEHRNNVDPWE